MPANLKASTARTLTATVSNEGQLQLKSINDGAATADEVLAELGRLCSQLAPGETGLFYRSGHVTRVDWSKK